MTTKCKYKHRYEWCRQSVNSDGDKHQVIAYELLMAAMLMQKRRLTQMKLKQEQKNSLSSHHSPVQYLSY